MRSTRTPSSQPAPSSTRRDRTQVRPHCPRNHSPDRHKWPDILRASRSRGSHTANLASRADAYPNRKAAGEKPYSSLWLAIWDRTSDLFRVNIARTTTLTCQNVVSAGRRWHVTAVGDRSTLLTPEGRAVRNRRRRTSRSSGELPRVAHGEGVGGRCRLRSARGKHGRQQLEEAVRLLRGSPGRCPRPAARRPGRQAGRPRQCWTARRNRRRPTWRLRTGHHCRSRPHNSRSRPSPTPGVDQSCARTRRASPAAAPRTARTRTGWPGPRARDPGRPARSSR
jgi:hypothetical protein